MRLVASLLLVVLFGIGCRGSLEAEGRAEAALAEGTLALRWGAPGLGLVHGEGELEGGAYWLGLPHRPPPAAFQGGLAVAEIVLLPAGANVQLGAPLADVQAIAADAVVYWADEGVALPEGAGCAVRTDAGLAPTTCRGLGLRFP
ncbi:MAG: hypothetical protein AAGH15_09935 [Myxococcota bacterium]